MGWMNPPTWSSELLQATPSRRIFKATQPRQAAFQQNRDCTPALQPGQASCLQVAQVAPVLHAKIRRESN
jgi:hypothetical protein